MPLGGKSAYELLDLSYNSIGSMFSVEYLNFVRSLFCRTHDCVTSGIQALIGQLQANLKLVAELVRQIDRWVSSCKWLIDILL